jgi:hypothetical protein
VGARRTGKFLGASGGPWTVGGGGGVHVGLPRIADRSLASDPVRENMCRGPFNCRFLFHVATTKLGQSRPERER